MYSCGPNKNHGINEFLLVLAAQHNLPSYKFMPCFLFGKLSFAHSWSMWFEWISFCPFLQIQKWLCDLGLFDPPIPFPGDYSDWVKDEFLVQTIPMNSVLELCQNFEKKNY